MFFFNRIESSTESRHCNEGCTFLTNRWLVWDVTGVPSELPDELSTVKALHAEIEVLN